MSTTNEPRHTYRRPASDISPKVAAATVAAAVTTIAVWGVEASTGIDIPTAVEIALTSVLVFVGGYLIPDRR